MGGWEVFNYSRILTNPWFHSWRQNSNDVRERDFQFLMSTGRRRRRKKRWKNSSSSEKKLQEGDFSFLSFFFFLFWAKCTETGFYCEECEANVVGGKNFYYFFLANLKSIMSKFFFPVRGLKMLYLSWSSDHEKSTKKIFCWHRRFVRRRKKSSKIAKEKKEWRNVSVCSDIFLDDDEEKYFSGYFLTGTGTMSRRCDAISNFFFARQRLEVDEIYDEEVGKLPRWFLAQNNRCDGGLSFEAKWVFC